MALYRMQERDECGSICTLLRPVQYLESFRLVVAVFVVSVCLIIVSSYSELSMDFTEGKAKKALHSALFKDQENFKSQSETSITLGALFKDQENFKANQKLQ